MGEKPFTCSTIERLDNNKDYCKKNCVWATPKEQASNRRNNIYITYNENVYTLFEICKVFNLIHSTTYFRLKKSNLNPQEYFEKYIF